MKQPNTLPPAHVSELRLQWQRKSREFQDYPGFREALNGLLDRAYEIAEFKRDEHAEFNAEQAEDEYELDLHIARVKVFDWYWLIGFFESDSLVEAVLEFCRIIEPDHEWEIIEVDGVHSVVTNTQRTLVADLKLCDQLSAAACLLYAGEQSMENLPGVAEELKSYLEVQRQETLQRLERMRKDIAAQSQSGEVIPFRPKK